MPSAHHLLPYKTQEGQKYSVEFSFENREAYKDPPMAAWNTAARNAIKERTGANGFAEPMDAWLAQQPPISGLLPLIRELASGHCGEERTPLKKARRIYDYITTHVMYSFVRSYFTLTDIVQYAALIHEAGDCGVQALCLSP